MCKNVNNIIIIITIVVVITETFPNRKVVFLFLQRLKLNPITFLGLCCYGFEQILGFTYKTCSPFSCKQIFEHSNIDYWKWKKIIGRIQGTKKVLSPYSCSFLNFQKPFHSPASSRETENFPVGWSIFVLGHTIFSLTCTVFINHNLTGGIRPHSKSYSRKQQKPREITQI